jgi:hypothetical protein
VAPLHFTVGFKLRQKAAHVVVEADDALIAALKVKMERPEAEIIYVRRRNRRGDARHPVHALQQPEAIEAKFEERLERRIAAGLEPGSGEVE